MMQSSVIFEMVRMGWRVGETLFVMNDRLLDRFASKVPLSSEYFQSIYL